MKKSIPLLTFCVLSFTTSCVSTSSEMNAIGTDNYKATEITYEQTQDIEFAINIKNSTKYNSYQTKNGTLIKVGDTLIVGSPSTDDSQYTQYIGAHKVFSFIIIGGMGMAVMGGMNYLPATSQGTEFTVEKIWVNHTKLSKNSPLIVGVTARDPNIPKLANKRTIMDLEKALLLGEIISPNAPMTREEAIKKLKESKDLLELGIIKKEEYDKIKSEMTPVIRGK